MMGSKEKRRFVGVGVGHSGTTWLFNCLDEHPEISGSKPKETKFFREEFDKGLAYYQKKFFTNKNASVLGEFTPSYIYNPEIAKRIKESFPNTKIIVVLRDPLEFIRSAYYFDKQRGIIAFTDLNQQISEDLQNPSSRGHYLISIANSSIVNSVF